MNRTKIEWADYTWNPIKGLCPVGCWYCYARLIYERFWKTNSMLRVDYAEVNAPFPRKPSRIFVCSTMELFHPEIDKLKIRDDIFDVIAAEEKHTFIVLTKMPGRIDRPMPENVWLGVSVTGAGDWHRVRELSKHRATIRFVSMEPLMGSVPTLGPSVEFNWLIVGRLTGHGQKHDPTLDQLRTVALMCGRLKIPLFMKDNLRSIWPGKLLQEWPR